MSIFMCRRSSRILFMFIVSLLMTVEVFALERINSDLITGEVIAPGFWEYFAYHSYSHLGDLSEDEIEKALKKLGKVVVAGGKDKDLQRNYRYSKMSLQLVSSSFVKRLELYKKSLASWHGSGRKGERPVFSLGAGKSGFQRTLSAFRKFAFEFPEDSHRDVIYFNLALLLSLRKNKNSEIYIKKMIKRFPGSKLRPAVMLLYGIQKFNDGEFKKAYSIFKKIEASRDLKSAQFAKYMGSWLAIDDPKKHRIRFSKQGVETLRSLGQADGDAATAFLKHEILSDLVRIWDSEIYLSRAKEQFEIEREPRFFLSLLNRYGEKKLKEKDYSKAISAYKMILKTSVVNRENPYILAKIVDLYEKNKDYSRQISAMARMDSLYLGRSPWAVANKDIRGAVRRFIASFFKKKINYLRSILPKNKEISEKLSLLMEIFINRFPDSRAAEKLRSELAVMQSSLEKHLEASDSYRRLGLAEKDKEKAYEYYSLMIKEIEKELLRRKEDSPNIEHPMEEKRPFASVAKKYVDRLDSFTKKYFSTAFDQESKYKLGLIYFNYGHYKEASQSWLALIAKFGEGKWGQEAILGVSSFYALSADWQSVVDFIQLMLKENKIRDKKVLESVGDQLRVATFSLAKKLEKGDQKNEAVAVYLGYFSRFPKAIDADKALYQAFILTGANKDTKNQISLGKKFSRSFSKSPLFGELTFRLAHAYASVLDLKNAKKHLSRLSKEFPLNPLVPQALKTLAKYYIADENFDQAIASYLQFVKSFPKDRGVSDAFSKLFDLLEEAEQQEFLMQAISLYEQNEQLKIKAVQLQAKALAAIKTTQDLDPVILEVSQAAATDKSKASKILAIHLLKLLKNAVGIEILTKYSLGKKNYRQILEKNKKRFSNIEAIDQKMRMLENLPYSTESAYHLGSMFKSYEVKLEQILKAKLKIDKIVLENAKYDAKEKSQAYFERVAEGLVGPVSEQGKLVYERMGQVYPKYKKPLELPFRPLFSNYSVL